MEKYILIIGIYIFSFIDIILSLVIKKLGGVELNLLYSIGGFGLIIFLKAVVPLFFFILYDKYNIIKTILIYYLFGFIFVCFWNSFILSLVLQHA